MTLEQAAHEVISESDKFFDEMARKRAIGVITLHREHWKRLMQGNVCSKQEGEESIAAFDVALAALSVSSTDSSTEKQDSSTDSSTDMISRQAAIEKIHWLGLDHDTAIKCDLAIRALPSVNPKPKTGHWIETAEEYYKAVNEYGGGVNEDTPYFVDDIACSVCLAKYSVIDNETERFDCCPSCGAEMEEQA